MTPQLIRSQRLWFGEGRFLLSVTLDFSLSVLSTVESFQVRIFYTIQHGLYKNICEATINSAVVQVRLQKQLTRYVTK